MTPKLIETIRVALAAAQEHWKLRPTRNAHLCVTHLEDALLRAMLVLKVDGLELPGGKA